MSRMIEYLNPKPHTIQLSSPDKKTIKIPGKSKIILNEWFMTYCPKYLRVVRVVSGKKLETNQIHNLADKRQKALEQKRASRMQPNKKREPMQNRIRKPKVRVQVPHKLRPPKPKRDPIVGVQSRENSNKLFATACQNNKYTVSNNIGIGILSFNRLKSLQRLINSIRVYTDLSKTTVFVSDESTDNKVSEWLKNQTDLVVLTKQKRIGIAGNTNRLMRCLSRFKHAIILNDDVEILSKGWENFYVDASEVTKIQHFCYQQAGVYGAKRNQKAKPIGKVRVSTINKRPHGAVIFYTNSVFQKVGYFDENFGMYGMEHVDWSTRVSDSGIQLSGFHDVLGSDKYFMIHQEKSAVPNRNAELTKARGVYQKLKTGPKRKYVNASKESEVPSVSVVIPIRDLGRKEAFCTVVNSIRSQLFPNIEIIIAEQDQKPMTETYDLHPRTYWFVKNKYPKQPFTKAMAFNTGVLSASYERVILQDADIICPSNYVKKIYDLLNKYGGAHIGSQVLYLDQDATNKVTKSQKIDTSANCERVVTYYEGGSLACTKDAYVKCGGFNEIFEGYGIEDCDFFSRLKFSSEFYNKRTEDFVHMWHGRTAGWAVYHRQNKKIFKQIKHQYNTESYVKSLVEKINKDYAKFLTK